MIDAIADPQTILSMHKVIHAYNTGIAKASKLYFEKSTQTEITSFKSSGKSTNGWSDLVAVPQSLTTETGVRFFLCITALTKCVVPIFTLHMCPPSPALMENCSILAYALGTPGIVTY